jgi:hypothetical protein
MIKRHTIAAISLAIAAVGSGGTASAQVAHTMITPAAKATALTRTYVLCINEGAQEPQAQKVLIDKYEPIWRAIEDSLSVHVISQAFTKNSDFAEYLPSGRCDVVFGKSVNILSNAVATMGYQPVVKDSTPYRIGFISGKPLSTLKDLRGSKISLPPPDTYVTTLAVSALLRNGLQIIDEDALLSVRDTPANVPGAELDRFNAAFANYDKLRREHVTIKQIRYIAAVPMTALLGQGDVGALNPQLLKKWPKDKPVLLMPPTIGWSVLANPKMPEAQVKALQAKLMTLQAPAMQQMWMTGSFVPATVAEMRALDDYLRPAREALLRRPGVTVAGR